ncbi:MAG: hypothetical protein ACOX66_06485 [Oscillospiraceae bacterium]
MTELDRDIALALLKRLREREVITQEEYIAACNSRVFDSRRFQSDVGPENDKAEG